MALFVLSLFLTLPLFASTTSNNLVRVLALCYSAKELRGQVKNEFELRTQLKRPDLRLRVVSGYSNNEISSTNPERLQAGVSLRWEDVTDNSNRKLYHDTMALAKMEDSKIALESYWRMRMQDLYYWKWGKSSILHAERFAAYTQKKLAAGEGSFQSLATTRLYSDLIELNRASSEFLGRMMAIEKEIEKCPQLRTWTQNLDFDQREITYYTSRAASNLSYQTEQCSAKKRIESIGLEKEAGVWGLALYTSATRNRQLTGGNKQFNDLRAGLEINIPITGAEYREVTVDKCDYETKLLQQEDLSERSISLTLYPILKAFNRQYKQIRLKIDALDPSLTEVQTQDMVQLGLNYFQLHQSLSTGESKINARILPSKIVEYEF